MLFRRISTKWVFTVLMAVSIPFIGFAWYVDTQTAKRQWEVVHHYLQTMAFDLAQNLDDELHERSLDIELKAGEQITEWAVEDVAGKLAFDVILGYSFDRLVTESKVYDLILAIDRDGKLVVANSKWPDGQEFPAELRASLEKRDYSSEPWFRAALEKQLGDPLQAVLVDHHVSPFLPPRVPGVAQHPENYHIGFAVPVRDSLEHRETKGVLYALMNWSRVQSKILRPKRPIHRVAGEDALENASDAIYATSYTWLWMRDADTIIAHPNTALYTKKVSEPPVDLPQLVAAARASDSGDYPEYSFGGKLKNAAFKHCAGPAQGGLGWVVGVGIDNADVTSFIDGLQDVLFKATVFVLVVVLVLTVLVARRTTAPILELQRQTQRIAAGDLDARVEVRSADELGQLARSFNDMTRLLAENRVKLIKAEKDAAWREMARQVAHEIKNPLTPISLSIALMQRAKNEGSAEFDSIFSRTVQLVTRQVEHMRQIASDFAAFAGARNRTREVLDVRAIVDDVLAENAAWAAECGVKIELGASDHGDARVFVGRNELRRVLINLVSNSIEAMPQGGKLRVAVRAEDIADGPRVRIEVEDNGVGLTETVRAHLFEPYFTTRSTGTGLGLAICQRLVEEMNGTIELSNLPADRGTGTFARVTLPAHRAASDRAGDVKAHDA